MALPRVSFVTGKGGTGKSTVAAALAIALSRHRPTTLADLDGRLCAAELLGVHPTSSTPIKVNDSLDVIALSARTELETFVERIVLVRMISRRMLRSRTFGYVTAALPGLEAFLLLEKSRILGGDAALHDRYVVIDAPASGSALELLSVASGVKSIAPSGTLNRLADSVSMFLRDATRFGAIVTASPEELAIREALETAKAIRDGGIATIAALMNRVPDAMFTTADLAALSPAGANAQLAVMRKAARERGLIGARRLANAGLETIVLPMLFTPAIGFHELSEIADVLEAELLD
jgi:arsenite/tail-anchored protein-transporting ATPase